MLHTSNCVLFSAPIIRDPANPMINVAGGLLSWSPFRKEFSRWARKIDLFHEVHDADTSGESTTIEERMRSPVKSPKYRKG